MKDNSLTSNSTRGLVQTVWWHKKKYAERAAADVKRWKHLLCRQFLSEKATAELWLCVALSSWAPWQACIMLMRFCGHTAFPPCKESFFLSDWGTIDSWVSISEAKVRGIISSTAAIEQTGTHTALLRPPLKPWWPSLRRIMMNSIHPLVWLTAIPKADFNDNPMQMRVADIKHVERVSSDVSIAYRPGWLPGVA